MVTGLLDTTVVVDLLRSHPPAGSWLAAQPQLGVSAIVWLEIIEGARDARAQRRALELLRNFERVDLAPPDCVWAIEQAVRFRLRANVGMMDCLIAASAQRLQVPLYTANRKHFDPLLGGLVRKPY